MTTTRERLKIERLLVRTARNAFVRELMNNGVSYTHAVQVAMTEIRPRVIDGVTLLVTDHPVPALRLEGSCPGPRAGGSFPGAILSPGPSPRSES